MKPFVLLLVVAFSSCGLSDPEVGRSQAELRCRTCGDEPPIDPRPVCGDGYCFVGETALSCPRDCTRCGDNICSGNETPTTCALDCWTCGDNVCTSPNERYSDGTDCLEGCFDLGDPPICDEAHHNGWTNCRTGVIYKQDEYPDACTTSQQCMPGLRCVSGRCLR